jgi:GT2 family glycosyltransferase
MGDVVGSGPPISILIVSYNTREVLRACLESLLRSDCRSGFETLVYDNASSDGSPEMVASDFAAVRLTRGQSNLGFGRASNLLANEAGGEWLMLLNSDTLLAPDSLSRLLSTLEAETEADLVAPRLLNADATTQTNIRRGPSPMVLLGEALGLPGAARADTGNGGLLPRGVYASGACLLVRREAWERLGGFDERFFFYGEDADLALRAADAGTSTRVVGEVGIRHLGGASASAMRAASAIEGYRSAFLYARLHHGATGLLAARLAVGLGSALRWLVCLLPLSSSGERRATYARVLRLCLKPNPMPTGVFGDD